MRYEAARDGLGERFLRAVDQLLDRLGSTEQCAIEEEVGGHPIRRAQLSRPFPYRLIFQDLPDEIRVLAVMHNARDPGFWHD